MGEIRVAELFAGVGGFRLGLDRAGGFKTVWANQWEPPGTDSKQFAWRCYTTSFGQGSCVNRDIHEVMDDAEAGRYEIPQVDMVVGGFPCFVAGTQVLTRDGYKPIEEIVVGDEVLTHRNRWRKVVKTGVKHNAPIVEVKARGSLPIRCTPNHPFMIQSRKRHIIDGKTHYSFSQMEERAASEINISKDFVAVPIMPDEIENPFNMTLEEAWLIGRYIADGHIQDGKRAGRKNSYNHKVIYSVGEYRLGYFKIHLQTYHATIHHHSKGASRAIITSQRLIDMIRYYAPGKGAENKTLSMEALKLPHSLMKELLNGYEWGDGGISRVKGEDVTNISMTTVSPKLARMIPLLIERVRGRVPQVYYTPMPETTVIEGRVVNQLGQYQIKYRQGPYKHLTYYKYQDHYLVKVRKVVDLEETATVYNFEVEEDHTYVVEHLVVHNCQDYSITKPLSQSHGIFGAKGVLWWEIYRFLQLKEPKYCLFENVDRLLKSPASNRGRDFAIMLSCMMRLGYLVEWRVVNSAEYGFPQRRKRVYIFAELSDGQDAAPRLENGVLARSFPAQTGKINEFEVGLDPYEVSQGWMSPGPSPFGDFGVAEGGKVLTTTAKEVFEGQKSTLGDILVPSDEVPGEYWLDDASISRWKYLKGSKRERRVAKNGHEYWYSEGGMSFPDPTDRPSRTILTGEGGRAASRFKHVVEQDGRLRRLVPVELERLQGFPDGWTATGMTDTQRAFCMGNALVVGVVEKIAESVKI